VSSRKKELGIDKPSRLGKTDRINRQEGEKKLPRGKQNKWRHERGGPQKRERGHNKKAVGLKQSKRENQTTEKRKKTRKHSIVGRRRVNDRTKR